MSEPTEKTIALNVRLKPVDHSDLPHSANCSNVGVAQGIAYLDFGFIEPALLGAIASTDSAGVGGNARCAASEGEKLTPKMDDYEK